MTELRCSSCNHWLGESSVALVFVEVVDRSSDSRVASPRDLRRCKSCGKVNVFVARKDLDGSLSSAVR